MVREREKTREKDGGSERVNKRKRESERERHPATQGRRVESTNADTHSPSHMLSNMCVEMSTHTTHPHPKHTHPPLNSRLVW